MLAREVYRGKMPVRSSMTKLAPPDSTVQRPTGGRPGVWAIGIYTGSELSRLGPAPGVRNPVLTHEDISDVPASFVADPFLFRREDGWFLFFEVKNRQNRNGEIGLAESIDGLRWQYRQIVLREPFHLSYPHVFAWDGEIYMIPETLAPNAIRLYRASRFPTEWVFAGTLLEGRFADSTVFWHEGRWWMFTCPEPFRHDVLRLFHAGQLMGPWREHPRSPIIQGDPRCARPGGRVTKWDGRLIRFTQDCVPAYGTAVRAFEISELTESTYREEELPGGAILTAGAEGWNSLGMHHIDPQPLAEGGWIASVDGRRPL
jgi:hypothetical protein